MTNTINGTRQLGDWEHQKFREDSTGKPAIAVVNADGTNIGSALSNYAATEAQQIIQGEILEEIEHAVQSIASAKGVAGDIRVTILSGTVTTVSTLSNQSSMGGWTASSLVPATSNTTAVLSNINNVGV